jgi:DNA-binding MarR family transcriptional regulator
MGQPDSANLPGGSGRSDPARQPDGAIAAPALEGGNLIAKAHVLGRRVFARLLKEHGVDELNPAQGRIIFELWKQDGLSQAELAARTKLDKSTLTPALVRLEEQGQLVREPDPSDGRRHLIRVTERNRAAHSAYLAASNAMLDLFYAGFSDDEIAAFESTLRRLIANLEASTQ